MPVKKRVLILSASIGSGHKIAARALEDEFNKHPDVARVVNQDALELISETYRKISSEAYVVAVKHTPWVVGWTYDMNDEPFKNEAPLRKLYDMLSGQPVVKFIKEYQPHITVCTHFTPAGIVAQLLATNQIDTSLSVVTTDYDFQGMWLSRTFNRYFVAREEAKARLMDFDVPGERITVAGIPVNPLFGQPVDRTAVLERYELDPDLPLIVVSAGAVGGGPAREIANQLLRLRHEVQTVMICGSNEQLRRDVEALVLPQANRFRIIGYTSDMPDLVRSAMLFVGKPGGLTASECMAAGTPMIVIAPIPGQEERNSDYLLEEGAAVRCNDIETIDYKIDMLLDNPTLLARLRANAARLGHADAAKVIVDTVLADEDDPFHFNWRAQRQKTRSELPPTLEAMRAQLFERSTDYMLALYDDTNGLFLGTITPSEYRVLRKHLRRDELVVTTVVTTDDIERLRSAGLGHELLNRIERRIQFRGPITLRRVRIPIPEDDEL